MSRLILAALMLIQSVDSPASDKHIHHIKDKHIIHAKKPYRHKSVGIASWYGPTFHGKRTANGEIFNQNAMTCAHMTLAFGTKIKVINLENNRSVVLRVNDRGGFKKYGRSLDISKAAAKKLKLGVGLVAIEVLDKSKSI